MHIIMHSHNNALITRKLIYLTCQGILHQQLQLVAMKHSLTVNFLLLKINDYVIIPINLTRYLMIKKQGLLYL